MNLLHCMIAEETVSCGKIVQRKEIADDVHISRKWEASLPDEILLASVITVLSCDI